ncbi:DUF4430 domain-containing protein [Romboutsia lituseburensis]|uniref:DUF4430 domain-containing protein n=1 Tax=Romboutsia lituseburensis TaxID=1537 RepID=UPI00215B5AF7|nr:DUF4430 domain-containing protein [Romboutsia lituseburensis]MCR8743801.1 DUF4430 domain-containing protein [Romboutsia lituseburensis]
MDKKILSIIAVAISFLLIIGLMFNSIFSRANKNENKPKENVVMYNSKKNKNSENDKKYNKDMDNKEGNIKEESKDSDNKELEAESNNNENNYTLEENKPNEENNVSGNDSNIENKSDINNSNLNVEQEIPKTQTVTVSISCKTAIKNGVNNEVGFTHLPSNGIILPAIEVQIKEGETVFDVLKKIVLEKGIHMEYTGAGQTIYIEGINNLYEFDGGKDSGWMYNVNGWYPNYGCGVYNLKDGDIIQWNYTCDLGYDLGARVN